MARNGHISMKVLSGFAAILLTVVLLLLSVASTGLADEKSVQKPSTGSLKAYPMRFVVLGDRTGGHVPSIFGQIVQEVLRLRPDFVVNVGDMIEGYTEDEKVLEEQWAEFKTLLEPLTVPVYLVPGNHDITTDGMVAQYKARRRARLLIRRPRRSFCYARHGAV